MKMTNNKIEDERVTSTLHKNGYIVSIIVLMLLYIDSIIKIYRNVPVNEYLSEIIIFFVGIFIFAIKNLIDKLPLMNIGALREKSKKEFLFFRIKCVLLGVLFVLSLDLISHQSIKHIIFDAIFYSIGLYIMTILFESITKKQEKKQDVKKY